MNGKTMTQLQVRIDTKTKEKAKKILEDLGLDASTAVKILFKQIVRTGTLPLEMRDTDDFDSKAWQDAGALDTLKELGPMSEEEYNYYMNLPEI